MRARIRSRGLEGRIEMLGGLNSHQVAAKLTRASVFALVSLEENAPLGIEEAMAVGVPVVASNRCGMPYMVRYGETGYLVDPLDPEAIAGRLGQLLADAGLRAWARLPAAWPASAFTPRPRRARGRCTG